MTKNQAVRLRISPDRLRQPPAIAEVTRSAFRGRLLFLLGEWLGVLIPVFSVFGLPSGTEPTIRVTAVVRPSISAVPSGNLSLSLAARSLLLQ